MSNALDREITLASVLRFTLPSIVMMVVMSLYTVVDGTFVSRLIGTDAFSAVNIVYPLMSVMVGIGTMFGTGATAVVSRKFGEGKAEEARKNFTFIIGFAVVLGALMMVPVLFFLEEILYLLGANEVIFPYCYDYAFPLVFFFIPNILQLVFQSLYVADGRPQIGLWVTVAGGVANIVLDYVFIACFGMGIAGAAAATGIGYSIPTVFGLGYFLFHKKGSLYFVKPQADWRMLGHVAANGSSEMVNNLSTSVTTLLFNIILMRLIGQDRVAAIGILLYLDFILIAVSLGYSIGAAPLFSYNYGSGDQRKLKELFRQSTLLSAGIGLFMTAATILSAGPLIRIFTPEGSSVYELAVGGLRIYAVSYLFKGYNIFSSAMFTAFGDGKVSAFLSILRTLVFLTAAIVIFAVLFGIKGVWAASPAAEALAFAAALAFTIKCGRKYHYLG